MDLRPLKPFHIIELNVISLIALSRRHELATFLKSHRPDAVLLCETNLLDRHTLHFPEYNFIRNDKTTGSNRRGTGILLKSCYAYKVIDPIRWNLQSLECTAVQLLADGLPITLISAYRNFNLIGNELSADLTNIAQNLASGFILGGDLNAKHESWHNSTRCPVGTLLNDWITTLAPAFNVSLFTSAEPTFYRRDVCSYLDLFIISDIYQVKFDPSLNRRLEVLDYPSDHRAVKLQLFLPNALLAAKKRVFKDYHNTDWSAFRHALEFESDQIRVFDNKIMDPAEIDTAVTDINNLITKISEEKIPKLEIKKTNIISLPPDLVDLIKHKNNLRRKWKRLRYNHNEHLLKSEIKCLTTIIQERISIVHEQYWTKTLKNVKNDRNVWKNINNLSGRVKKRDIPTLIESDCQYEDDEAKANALGHHFEKIHQQNVNLGEAEFTNNINNTVRTRFHNNFEPLSVYDDVHSANPSLHFDPERHFVGLNTVLSIVKSRQNKKSCGTDEIPNVVLRKLGPRFWTKVVTLLNQAYNIGYFPTAWKIAKVIPLCKKGKKAEKTDSYRPISLLPCISKIFECALKDRIWDFCEEHNILPDDQFGFRHRRSTTHPLVLLQNYIISKINNATPTIAVALDIAKAFDTAWIEGLVHKMINYKFDTALCRMMFNYLTDRQFFVLVNDAKSTSFNIAAGVPQGGVLSALLYVIYIADMPLPPTNPQQIQRLQFADDTLIYVGAKNLHGAASRLTNYIKTITEYQDTWKIRCSEEKCELIVFKGPNRLHSRGVNHDHSNVRVKVGSNVLVPQNHLKYLGVTFANNARFKRHTDLTIKKANAAVHALGFVLRKRKALSSSIKKMCYTQLVRPILSYGFPCWSSISAAQMERIRVAERKCLRLCTNYSRPRHTFIHQSNARLYRNADIQRIDRVLVEQNAKFYQNLNTTEMPFFNDVINHDPEQMEITEFKPPWFLEYMRTEGRTHHGDALIHYHQRYRPNATNAAQLVYNIRQ